jgi:hypothetical protein
MCKHCWLSVINGRTIYILNRAVLSWPFVCIAVDNTQINWGLGVNWGLNYTSICCLNRGRKGVVSLMCVRSVAVTQNAEYYSIYLSKRCYCHVEYHSFIIYNVWMYTRTSVAGSVFFTISLWVPINHQPYLLHHNFAICR